VAQDEAARLQHSQGGAKSFGAQRQPATRLWRGPEPGASLRNGRAPCSRCSSTAWRTRPTWSGAFDPQDGRLLKTAPPSLKPGLICRLANQPWFISSTKRTGLLEQCESSLCGCMSAKLTMVPSSSTKCSGQGNQGVAHPKALGGLVRTQTTCPHAAACPCATSDRFGAARGFGPIEHPGGACRPSVACGPGPIVGAGV
jgi:hypothetical protein